MEIRVTPAAPEQLKPKPADESKLGFGSIFSDHMFLMEHEDGKGWFNPRVEPYRTLDLDPAALGIHYALVVFEGLKAYYGADGEIYLFRPEENLKRLNNSAPRICMPPVDADAVREGMKRLIWLDRAWIPNSPGTSLYVRPVMIASEAHLSVRPSKQHLFYIIVGPVGAYYKEGLNPVKIYVEDQYVRAAPGGTGATKTAGNYGASLYPGKVGQEQGYQQVLWLDGIEHRYVEEVGAMNIFFRFHDRVVTPDLRPGPIHA